MRLSSNVSYVLGNNPSPFTLNGTNTFLVGSGATKILIDTGQGVKSYLPSLFQAAESLKCILITHNHIDHIGGIDDIQSHYGPVPIYKYKVASDRPDFIHTQEGDQFQIEDCTLEVVETPGHSDDSISFWFPQEKALFTGDIILGTGSTLLNNYTKYLQSIEKMSRINPEVLYTAHGEPKVSGNKIQADLRHRKEREEQILKGLNGRMRDDEIMRAVYGELHPGLVQAALVNTRLYLDHLRELGLLNQVEGNWFKL